MKKEKKPGIQQKDFASRPFGLLKGVRTERQAEPPRTEQAVKAPPAKPETSAADADLFLRAVEGVKRLHPAPEPKKSGAPSPPKPLRLDEEERAVFLRALENLKLDVTFQDELPDEERGGRPLHVNRLRQVKRGTIRIDFQLDLHGLTRDEALQALSTFIAGAYNRGQKAVLVITGKGNRSPGEPVLQGAVTGWLRERGKGMVAEFAPAPRELGGSGAFVVFLKEKNSVL